MQSGRAEILGWPPRRPTWQGILGQGAGNCLSTMELVPSTNATRLLRTVGGMNTPALAPNFC